jgi:hypothetical protein
MLEPRPPDTEGLWRKFQNFDEQKVYNAVCEEARNPQAKNFVVLFGPSDAKVAVDLGADDFDDLFHLSKSGYPVRWINFWNTTEQRHAINNIGAKYGFTRRLLASINAWDKYRDINRAADLERRRMKHQLKPGKEQGSDHPEKADLESGLSGEHEQVPRPTASTAVLNPETPDPEVMENFRVIQNSLNYTTTDYGTHCK